MSDGTRRIVLVTGLSGAGKSSILRALEDLGYEAVDNPPLRLIDDLVARGECGLAIGVDVRSRGFRADAILQVLDRLRRNAALQTELVYAVADRRALLRRYSETRRRHPLAPARRVSARIAASEPLTIGLPEAADLLFDTSELPPAVLSRVIERSFGPVSAAERAGVHTVLMLSSRYVPFGVGSGPMHAAGEQLLRESTLRWTILRPAEFMSNALRWVETIQNMALPGVDTIIELGPGKVLSGLVRRIDKGLRAYPVEDPAGLSTVSREVFK